MRLELEPGADDGETYSVDEAIEAVGFGRYQVGVLLMAGLCWTADAMEMLLLSYIKEPMKCEWGISDLEAASVASAVGFGMLAGSTFWGVVADSFGRPPQRPACSPPAPRLPAPRLLPAHAALAARRALRLPGGGGLHLRLRHGLRLLQRPGHDDRGARAGGLRHRRRSRGV